ncbi:MAG TPA: hypothetical protein PKY82_35125 [Pyrinomonadaceae bacterium]|nr:hypothetical protein [Pyrinomonadaceae bacterium]
MISSLLLALDAQKNQEETDKVDFYFICAIQEKVKIENLCEINQILSEKSFGKLLPIYSNENETTFTIIPYEFENCFRLVKRLLWEFGILLSTEITLIDESGVKTIKEYGCE